MIDAGGCACAADIIIVGAGGQLIGFVPKGLQFSLARGAELNTVARLGAIGRDRKPLIAARHELHGTPQFPRGERDQSGARRHRRLAAKGAADIRTDHPHIGGIDRELLRHAMLQAADRTVWLGS